MIEHLGTVSRSDGIWRGRVRYPPSDPFETGQLDVGDGQSLFYELSGRRDGKPAVILHGGPGGGSRPGSREQFDPDAYLIVQFDQRGAGRSTPSLAEFDTDATDRFAAPR